MSMQTADGKRTNKFDTIVPSVYLDRVDGLKERLDEIEENADTKIAKLEERVVANNRKHNTVEAYFDKKCEYFSSQFNDQERLLSAFLCSPLMRFLNFFGCWYIYSKTYHGYPFLNVPENEKYGKAPLLTRISRWFKKHFPKQRASSDTYYNDREPEENMTEVCTNDEQRDEPERVETPQREGPSGAVLERDPDGDH